MKAADLEAGMKNLDEYLTTFYRVKREKLSGQPAPPAPIDPQRVGAEARRYMDAELAKGHQISATEAVGHVLGKS
jgi:hypothetical protein